MANHADVITTILKRRYEKMSDTDQMVLQLALSDMALDEVVCLISTYSSAADLVNHCQLTNNQLGFWDLHDIQTGPMLRWKTYCMEVEQRILGKDDNDNQVNTQNTVFGNCRKCGSKRLVVRTKQLRRADEGATELRTCHDCGHTSRVNS